MPTKYWLSTLPRRTSLKKRVYVAKLRWRIERDYEELKQEIGLGHYEGRKWRGFHHHATLYIAAYAFLVAERGLFPPGGASSQSHFNPLAFPQITDPTQPPVRVQRHNPTSIATLRAELIMALVRRLQRCPCCQRKNDMGRASLVKLIE